MSSRPPIRPGLRPAGTFTPARAARETLVEASFSNLPRDVIVDLESVPSRATIVRGGKEVATPIANPERAATLLENFIPIGRDTEPRSVRQTIAAGTLVTLGTAVDVEFLTPDQVTLGIFEGVHLDLRARSVTSLAALLQDAEVSTLIAKPAADLTDAEKQNLRVKLQTANVGVDDAVADRSLGAAIMGLKTAQAFR